MTSEQTPSAAEDCDTVKSRLKTNLDGSVILLIPRKIIIYYYANVSAGHIFFFFTVWLLHFDIGLFKLQASEIAGVQQVKYGLYGK